MVVHIVLPAVLCLVLVGEAGIITYSYDIRLHAACPKGVGIYQLYWVSLQTILSSKDATRAGTCDEFEGLGDIPTELFRVWHLNVRHVGGAYKSMIDRKG